MIRIEIEQCLPSLRSKVFDIMSLIENHVFPTFSAEYLLVVDDKLIGSNADMPCILFIPTFPFLLALFGVAVIGENFETRSPFLELHFPVENDASRNDNEMWSPNMLLTSKMRNESDCLNCFPIISHE